MGEEHLPEWEVCIRAWGPDDPPDEPRTEFYHPRAEDEETAREKAIEEAKGIGINAIVGRQDAYEVAQVAGPYHDNVIERTPSEKRADRVGEEQATLEEVGVRV